MLKMEKMKGYKKVRILYGRIGYISSTALAGCGVSH